MAGRAHRRMQVRPGCPTARRTAAADRSAARGCRSGSTAARPRRGGAGCPEPPCGQGVSRPAAMSSTCTTHPSQPPPASERARTAWPNGALSEAGWSSTSTTSRYWRSVSGRIMFVVPKRGCTPPSMNFSPRSSDNRSVVAGEPVRAGRIREVVESHASHCRRPTQRSDGGVRVGRVQRQGEPGGEVAPAVLDEHVVRRLPDQLDQLRTARTRRQAPPPGAPRCCPSSTSRGRVPPAPHPRRSYSVMVISVYDVPSVSSTSRKSRRTGSCQHTSGLVSSGCRSLRKAQPCKEHPAPPGNPGRLRKMQAPSCTAVLRSPSESFSDPPLALRSDVVELPVLGGQLGHDDGHPSLVVAVGEVRAERAAAVVGSAGVDPGATRAEDARPSRAEPRQVATQPLVGVGGVDELDPGARKVERDFGHGSL